MRLSQLSLYLATFLVGAYAIPRIPGPPEAFKKVIVGRQIGGNCNFTGVCMNNGNDIGECIGESSARCCHESSFHPFSLAKRTKYYQDIVNWWNAAKGSSRLQKAG
ncbi:hypothetical protein B0J11DRAFT_507701 [Dendryphion nanum]|uniref:Uncharacterized protein n=1 Tax=Dendryphion nanum TaxID=256645 RepID=A0A9P9DQG8_9PLEO|nr:hypothetical protein B0J11DRAFT_507701 [Dendryphion nanum]